MEGNLSSLRDLNSNYEEQFKIPVYQRNYSWKTNNCKQLYEDLVELDRSGGDNHFFGSIVLVASENGNNKIIIDGQQRITSVSLLILAAIQAVKDGLLKDQDDNGQKDAWRTFIKADCCQDSENRNIKLVPIDDDLDAYDEIVAYVESAAPVKNKSNFYTNFNEFYKKFKSKKDCYFNSIDQLLSALDKFQIVVIELDSNDDPQLIFESLNSTGAQLTEVDKIRNYLLMHIPDKDQDICYKHWEEIEKITSSDSVPDLFFMHYLAAIQDYKNLVKKDKLYIKFKQAIKETNKSPKEVLAHIRQYVLYYDKCRNAKFDSELLKKKMLAILAITNVSYVFFMSFLHYADEQKMPDEERYKVISLIENFLMRRYICDKETNELKSIFCSLHSEILESINDYKTANIDLKASYSDILSYHLVHRRDLQKMPTDADFVESLNKYKFNSVKNKVILRILFDYLENHNQKEKNDVLSDMSGGKEAQATIEHIMPKNLNSDWRTMLGDDCHRVHSTYLNTLANLTLTGKNKNSELSNRAFDQKCHGFKNSKGERIKGYKESKYRFTAQLLSYQQWTEIEIQDRAKKIGETLLDIYPWPQDKFQPLLKYARKVNLNDNYKELSMDDLLGYSFLGDNITAKDWADLLGKVIKQLESKLKKQNIAISFTNREGISNWLKSTKKDYQNNSIQDGLELLKLLHNLMKEYFPSEDFFLLLKPNDI